jgi:hypothetical protein
MNYYEKGHLPVILLLSKGFKLHTIDGVPYYEHQIINGIIRYSPHSENYAWYMVTILGEASNHLQLNIRSQEDLDLFMKVIVKQPN